MTFPEVTICAAYEISYKSEVLDKYKIHMEQFRRNFKYPNVSNLTGNYANNICYQKCFGESSIIVTLSQDEISF